MIRFLCILVLLTLCSTPSFTTHIIGGFLDASVIEFSQNSDSLKLDVNITLISDCSPSNFPLSHIEFLSIYSKAPGADFIFYDTILFNLAYKDTLTNFDYGCLTVPYNSCINYGVFNQLITIPNIVNPYTLVFQRCCRSGSITNILEPELEGFNLTLEISQEALISQNSSPKLRLTNSITICVNELTNFNIPIEDEDGDSISITLCELSSFDEDLWPYAPPYPNLPYMQFSNFSVQNPFGDNASLEFVQETNSLNIFPTIIGQYAIAFCIKEYRSGILIGETNLDFQINVVECQNEVKPQINSDMVDADGTEIVTLCNDNTLTINNLSTPIDLIEDIFWQIQIGEEFFTSSEWEPFISFPSSGIYNGKLLINQNGECPDSITIKFVINDNFNVDFEIDSIQCLGEPINIYDRSTSDQPIEINCYSVGLDSFIYAPNISYFPPDTGLQSIYYLIIDEYGCIAQKEKILNYQPFAPPPIQTAVDTTVCTASGFYPIFNDEDYDIWYFQNISEMTPIVINESGYQILTVSLQGCEFSENIYVDAIDCNAKLYIPNVFSPNNDGFNDLFGPQGKDFEVITFRVFDRWGSILFESDSNNTFWDGRVNGKFLDAGVYIYSLSYRESLLMGDVLVKSGTITLVR